MYYRVALDTFHFGLKCDFVSVDDILSKIKNYLFFNPEISKSRNPYYRFCWSHPFIGFNVFFDLKNNLCNCPISIELDGHFFRDDVFSEKFVNFIFSEFGDIIFPQRADACIDVIYDNREEFLSKEVSCFYSPGFPIPSIRPDFKYNVSPFEGHFDLVGGVPFIDLISSGRGEKKLRVYDKDLDLQRKEEKTYSEVYGLKSSRAFRVEYAVRSDSIKGLFSQYKISSYTDLVYLLLSGMFKRYSFENVDLGGVFSEDVSFYLKRDKSTLDGQISNCLNNLRKYHNQYLVLNKKRYESNLLKFGEPSLFEKRNFLRNVDFYEVSKSLEKEGFSL